MSERWICYNCFAEREESEGCCPYCGYDPAWDSGKYPLALSHGHVLCDKYIIGRVLGQGGYGITYLAMDKWLGMKVAVKEYFPEVGASRTSNTCYVTCTSAKKEEEYQKGKEDFLHEARLLATFAENPNIVKIHGYFEENNTAYFVMDYIEGISFQKYIKNQGGKIEWRDAYEKLLPIIKALEEVHQKDIIHRDISPDNIYMNSDGTMKLLDFGAARIQSLNQSHSLDVVLKHGYAPFEQYSRRGKQGPFTDVYALCACFYAAVTGVLPPDAPERMMEDSLEPFAIAGVEVPTAVEQVIFKGLSVHPEHRFQNMVELREALEQAVLYGNGYNEYVENRTVNEEQVNYCPPPVYETVTADTTNNATASDGMAANNNVMLFINKNKKLIGIIAACIVLVFGGMGIYRMAHNHNFSLWEVVEEANCTETGMKKRKCSCGVVEKREIPIQHQFEVVPAVAATCTESGLTEGSVCSLCGFVETEQMTIDALGHTMVTEAAVEATCTEEGHSEGTYCSTCGEVVTASETVAALGHSFSSNECTRCGVEKWWAEIWTAKTIYKPGEEITFDIHIYTNEPGAVITPYDAILINLTENGTYDDLLIGDPWEGEFEDGANLSSTWTVADYTGVYGYGLMDEEGNCIATYVFVVEE